MSLIYRRTRPADRVEIKKILGVDDLREPLVGFACESNKDGLLGFSYVHKAALIQPFFCKEPTIALKLLHETQGALSALDFSNIVVEITEENKDLIQEMRRLGFTRVHSRYFIFKRDLDGTV